MNVPDSVRMVYDWDHRPAVSLWDGRVFAILELWEPRRGWKQLGNDSANDVLLTAAGLRPEDFAERFPYADLSSPDLQSSRPLWEECDGPLPGLRYRFRYRPAHAGLIQTCYAGPDLEDARQMVATLRERCDRLLPLAPSYVDPTAPRCHLCGSPFGEDTEGGEVYRQSLKNARYLASPDGAEACEQCAAEAFDDAIADDGEDL